MASAVMSIEFPKDLQRADLPSNPVGNFVRIGHKLFSGFVVDHADLFRKFTVDILVDGIVEHVIRADRYVDTLARMSVGDACYGFVVSLDDELIASREVSHGPAVKFRDACWHSHFVNSHISSLPMDLKDLDPFGGVAASDFPAGSRRTLIQRCQKSESMAKSSIASASTAGFMSVKAKMQEPFERFPFICHIVFQTALFTSSPFRLATSICQVAPVPFCPFRILTRLDRQTSTRE